MEKKKRPFVLQAEAGGGISLVVTAICKKCNAVVEMKTNPRAKKQQEGLYHATELQCPKCKTIYSVPAIEKRMGRNNEITV